LDWGGLIAAAFAVFTGIVLYAILQAVLLKQ